MAANLEKTSRIIDLYEVYGELLAEKQRTYVQSYYLYLLEIIQLIPF